PVEPATAGHLSYSALADYAGCGYRFYVERVLGLTSPLKETGDATPDSAEDDPDTDELIAPASGPRRRALAVGNTVHAILERSARRSWLPPNSDEVLAILAREGIGEDREARERTEALVAGWLDSGMRRQLEERTDRLRPEVPFVLGLSGAVVRGKIDLVAPG